MSMRFIRGVMRVPEGTDAPGGAAAAAPAVPVQPAAPPPSLPNAPPADDGARTQTFKQMLDSATAAPPTTTAPATPTPEAQPAKPTPPVQVTQPPKEPDPPAEGDAAPPKDDATTPPAAPTKSALDIELDDDFDFDAPDTKAAAADGGGEGEESATSREEEAEIWKSIKDTPLDDITNDPEIADRVRGALFKTGRGRRMLVHHNEMNAIARPESEGGIGFSPSSAQVKEMYERSTAYEDLAADLEEAHSAPEKAERLLNFMLRDAQGPRKSAATLAQTFPAVLAKASPEAFQGLQSAMLVNYLRILDAQAERAPNPQDRDYAQKLSAALAHHMGYNRPAQRPGEAAPAQGQHRDRHQDPEVARLMRENEEMREQLSGAERANFDNYLNTFLGDGRQVVSSMLDKALPNVRELLGGDSIADPYLRDRIDDVLDRVARDTRFMQGMERRVQRAYQSRDQQARDQALADFKRHVRSHVLPVARSIQEALRGRAGQKPVDVAANAALHQQMQQRQEGAAAEGQGAPAHAATAPSVEWNPKIGATANFKNILNAIPR